ncbi:flagellar basal body-associated FliL family protein [Jatrophihabitans telluris]|uniref:Flagellar protein FliL n=1 Tax=Jatrophihabitans telluris TaxID=2038343 RepID=A0ABY4QXG6_9ACTN|nr:flagellar basal body-associated FliL family protein [Jatrophihabitans telluris]UQX87962.1 flagellar basal body-associated FliL family protein [Jatrophihabitans telluris]
MATATDTTRVASQVKGSDKKGGKGGDGSDGADETGGKKKSMKMKIILAVVVLLVAGGAAKFTILKPAAKTTSASKAAAKPVPGPTILMDEMTLNLADGHFLRLKLSVITTKGTAAALDLTEGIQATIDEYSNQPVSALTGTKARTKAKNALLKEFKKIYPKKILDLIYTEFVMQ